MLWGEGSWGVILSTALDIVHLCSLAAWKSIFPICAEHVRTIQDSLDLVHLRVIYSLSLRIWLQNVEYSYCKQYVDFNQLFVVPKSSPVFWICTGLNFWSGLPSNGEMRLLKWQKIQFWFMMCFTFLCLCNVAVDVTNEQTPRNLHLLNE